MHEKVHIGVIGTSGWADYIYLPLLKADGRVTISAICGRTLQRAQELATKYDIPTVYTDYRHLLEHANLHAVVIATPDDQHYAMTMAAVDAGLHILCEKPLALNASHAGDMYNRAEEKGVRHMTFFTWRWMPHYRMIRDLIEEGVLGRLYHSHFSFLAGNGRKPEYRWRYDRTRANGVLGDLGSHMFDLARYLIGDMAGLSANLASHIPQPDVHGQIVESANDSAIAIVEFMDGGQGIVQASNIARIKNPYFEQHVTLHGEGGSLIASLNFAGSMQLHIARGEEPFQPVPLSPQYLEGIDATSPLDTQFLRMFTQQPIGCRLFIDAILEDRPVVPSFYEGWKVQQAIDAAIASHENGKWVPL